ncbi:MAG: SAM-dependent methyltransferase [Chloroflexota bacterium]
MKNVLALIAFIILQILFIPLAILGALWVAYRQIIVSRRLGVSQTAIEIINGRWTMHIFGLRQDDAAAKLAAALPNTSTNGLWLALFPLYIYYRISGSTRWYPVIAERGKEGLANLVLNRTGYFDSIIDAAKDQAVQFVVLGAGLDTRANNHQKQSVLKIFELYKRTTQQLKRQYLQKAGVNSTHVTFVEADFSQADWFNALTEAGYNPNGRTIFLWEGVTLYLGESSVRDTLRTLKANAAQGSIIAADIYSKSFISGEYAPGLKATLPVLDLTDEQLSFGLEMAGDGYQQALEAFATSEQLTLGQIYFMGHKTKKGTWMVVAELIV